METLFSIVRSLAALSLAGYGVFAILRPQQAARLIHVTPDDNRALAEIRVNLGGFFVGLGLMPILLNVPGPYLMAGGAYLFAAVTRFVSAFVDRPPIDAQYIGFSVLELVLGAILII